MMACFDTDNREFISGSISACQIVMISSVMWYTILASTVTPVYLVDNNYNYTGRLKVTYKGGNYSVCSDGFGVAETSVVCRMLGFSPRNSRHYNYPYTGAAIHGLTCTWREKDLSECNNAIPYLTKCPGSTVVGIECQFQLQYIEPPLNDLTNKDLEEEPLNKTPNVRPIEERSLQKSTEPVISCLDDCNGNGHCITNGSCLCIEGFGGADCSVNTTIPPSLVGLTNYGLCDIFNRTCTSIHGFGETFYQTITCRLRQSRIYRNGTIRPGYTYTTSGHVVSQGEFKCPLSEISSDSMLTTFVIAYDVSVSNGDFGSHGLQFSNEMRAYMYDSTCQGWTTSSGVYTFMLKEGTCHIDGHCYVEKEHHPDDDNKICLPSSADNTWTTVETELSPSQLCEIYAIIQNCECEIQHGLPRCRVESKTEKADNNVLTIWVPVTCGLVLIIVVMVAVVIYKLRVGKQRRLRERQQSNTDLKSRGRNNHVRNGNKRVTVSTIGDQFSRQATDGRHVHGNSGFDPEDRDEHIYVTLG